jgi:hypothetical protein
LEDDGVTDTGGSLLGLITTEGLVPVGEWGIGKIDIGSVGCDGVVNGFTV